MIFEVRNLIKKFQGKPVVNQLSFHISKGEVVGLLGPNGAGKTTAFYMAVGLIRPDAGDVFFQGQKITKLSVDKRAKMGLGYLSQEPSVFRTLTVKENILAILETLPLSKKHRLQKLDELLEELHLHPFANQKAITLSGGERRRLEITRALVREPSILLLDEPFANIDPLAIADVKHLITVLKKKGIAILITDHNARELISIVDRSYLMRDGKVIIEGSVHELLANADARKHYFGEDFRL